MIRKLTGLVDSIQDEGVILDVHGVGYEVHCPKSMTSHLPPVGQPATLWIATAMNEHAILLYGFASAEDLHWFHLLTSVHGVGNRAALAILGALSAEDLAHTITSGEGALLMTVQGIGKKLVQRIINELKDKVPQAVAEMTPLRGAAHLGAHGAISALVNLGYTEYRARMAVGKVMAANTNQSAATEEIIRACLRELA